MTYTGDVCYVPPDGIELPTAFVRAKDGATVKQRRLFGRQRGPATTRLVGGWHYSTKTIWTEVERLDPATGKREVVERVKHEVPDRPLHLNDAAEDEAGWFYEFAEEHHESWLVKYGNGRFVQLEGAEE